MKREQVKVVQSNEYSVKELRAIAATVKAHFPAASKAIHQLLRKVAARERGE